MNILIVDDEYYARKALVQIVSDWDSSLRVTEAENGQDALAQIEASPPDMVFTDIQLPLLDGLQLAAVLHEKYPHILNVIVSGYDDFKYAQKAIVYRVEDYVLKPVDKQEVIGLLEQGKRKHAEAAARRRAERLYAILAESDGDPTQELPMLPDVRSFAIAVQQTGRLTSGVLHEIVADTLSKGGVPFLLLPERRCANMSIILLMNCSACASEGKQWLREHPFHQIVSRYREQTGDSLSVGISDVHSCLSALPVSYREARDAVLCRLLGGGHFVYRYGEALKNSGYNLNVVDELILPLYNKIVNNQAAEAVATVRRVLDMIVDLKLSVYTLNDTCAKLISILNSVIERINKNDDRFHSYFQPVDLHRFQTMDQIAGFFEETISDVSETLEKSGSKADIIDDLKAYVERNYQHQIVFEDIAKHMYFTDPSYLSRQFKKKNGMNFSKFLIAVRLNKARKLLDSNSRLTVSEIACAVGFNDASHFIQMYKKFFGETPGKRKSHPCDSTR